MILKDDNNKELPEKVQKQLKEYVERIKNIKWFKPDKSIDKKELEKQVSFSLECFGIKASVEYRKLETAHDWDAAWDAARDAARDAAWDAARDAAWDAARDAAWGAQDLLVLNLDSYKEKYPQGNFINLIPIWELGLYPIGVIDGKFIIYIPPIRSDFPEIK